MAIHVHGELDLRSTYFTDEIKDSVELLLKFEKLSYKINDLEERNRFYIATAYHINKELDQIIAKSDNIEALIEELIDLYENELTYPPYHISIAKAVINHQYIYHPLTDNGIENKVYYKEAVIQRDQYISFYKFYKDKILKLTEYLYDLRLDLFGDNIDESQLQKQEAKILYYENLQNLLVENLSITNQNQFIRTIKDEMGKVIYLDWLSDEDSIMHTRFHDYFEDDLLAATRERENGVLIKDIIYGENDYSKYFFNYIYKNNFSTSNYDHYTEVHYLEFQEISEINFYTLNNKLLGSIIYTYDNNKRLINEVWFNQRKVLRHFTCSYQLGQGKFRVTERDSSGNIIYQDIVNSLDEEKFIKRK